ncbi:DNA-binding GntR family transcriptional regulator [Peteryoungia aggregata LMG 23059]|uniref:DNA-binding GntR family transcriptional regulator n=1 Tax=Peteryoungia aggregata LMG 23059 TaxID=1368425 RepID=A0ABU0G2A1_9HYPH|nr:GntR family transcriptional regulator [Peteryoungia aggregata]MDQ0419475.1 DNA-binding GntR family transcriptional regulator [Peteryoungia aggregata LMG 23059]
MLKRESDLADLRIETPPATLREIALDRLRRAIIAGLFEPGQRLVERTLCDQLGVSRSVIREVIRHLESEGLVENIAKQGPIVATIAWDDARQIYEIRSALESTAAADCARHADAAVKAKLGAVLAELDRTSKNHSPPAILDATHEFYKIMFEASGHTIAWEIVNRLNGRISRLRVMTLSTSNRTVSGPARMREIYEAIERNDPERAAAACRAHVEEAATIAERILKS